MKKVLANVKQQILNGLMFFEFTILLLKVTTLQQSRTEASKFLQTAT